MPISAVVFDFFGTLTPSTPAAVWDEHAARSAAPLRIDPAEWRAALDASFPERARGALGNLKETFRTLARRCGHDPDEAMLEAACATRVTAQRELFALRPDAIGTLAEIRKRGHPVGVLSDCAVELADAWASLPLAEHVDAVVLSCEVGRRKPDPELFRMITDRLCVTPTDCLYVGDGGGSELTGATACGMTAYMLRADDWHDNDAHAREDDWAGPALRSLPEVLTVLDRLPA